MDKPEFTTLNYFDRAMGNLHGMPEVIETKATTLRVVPPFGLGTYVYVVQTFRQRDSGDTIFVEHVSEQGTIRLVIPPAVAETIARQRDQLTAKSRSRAGKARAEQMKQAGIQPGFMKARKGGSNGQKVR